MKYLCLVYEEEARVDALPEREYEAIVADALAYRDELRQRGHDIAWFPLQPARTATSLRVRNGKLAITDGPAAESTEHLSGCYLIEARDLNAAIRMAARMPPARLGSIEVRPLKEIEPFAPRRVAEEELCHDRR